VTPQGSPSDAFDVIVRVLTPYLGENMARAAVRGNRDHLGLTGRDLARADLERFLERIGPGLGVFVGRHQATRILEEIRRATDEYGGGS
jgi:hypothetical protein